MAEGKECPVKVAVRSRPLSVKEEHDGATRCLEFIEDKSQVVVALEKGFTFDYTFDDETTQETVYKKCVAHLVDMVLKGYNATVLAYGQTGSGKTYTMGTDYHYSNQLTETDIQGIIPRALIDIFKKVKDMPDAECLVKISFIEIYNEEVYDLLSTVRQRKSVHIQKQNSSVVVLGLEELKVNSVEVALSCLKKGCETRTKGATALNANSSRSHAIFTVHVEQLLVDGYKKKSKLHLVDLAGSEMVRKTKSEGNRFKEGVNINLGLLALGNVINILCTDGGRKQQNYIPYRNSTLTRFLKDSICGNSLTVMIACINPADSNLVETVDTLRYANRARNIKTKPVINRCPIKDNPLKRKLEMVPPTPAIWRRGPGFNNTVNTPITRPAASKQPCLNSTVGTPYQTTSINQEQKTPIHIIPSPPSSFCTPSVETVNKHESTHLEESQSHSIQVSPELSFSTASQMKVIETPYQFSPFARKLCSVLEESICEKFGELESRIIKQLTEKQRTPKCTETRCFTPLDPSCGNVEPRIYKEAQFFPSPFKDRTNMMIEESSSSFLKPKNTAPKKRTQRNSVLLENISLMQEKENCLEFTGYPELNSTVIHLPTRVQERRRSTRCSVTPAFFHTEFQPVQNKKQTCKSTSTDRSNIMVEESSSPFLKPKNPAPKRQTQRNSLMQESENCLEFTEYPELNSTVIRLPTRVQERRRSTRCSVTPAFFHTEFQPVQNKKQTRKSISAARNFKSQACKIEDKISTNGNKQKTHNAKVLELLNTGTVKELQSLPCIGPKTAKVLITWRELRGSLASLKDLKKFEGLSGKFYHQFIKTNLLTTSPV